MDSRVFSLCFLSDLECMAYHFYYNISERMMDADVTGCQKSCITEEYSVETRAYLDVNYPSR